MSYLDDLELVVPASREEWRTWLAANHATSKGIALAVAKKNGSRAGVAYEEAVEEALCFGWIDSTTRTLDADRYTILVTRRKRGSVWARSNKERVKRLTAAGLMTPAGQAAIDAAKADGSWTILDEVEAGTVPADLAAALDAAQVADRFAALTPSVRKMALYHIASAKRPETRAKRIAETVAQMAGD